jgi:integrase
MLYTKQRSDGRNYFYWRAKYIDNQGRRRTKRLATGIVDDGTPASKLTATTIGHRLQVPLAAGGERAARSTRTLKQACAELVRLQKIASRHDASITIIVQKSARLFDHFGPGKLMADIEAEDVTAYAQQALAARAVATVSRELLVLRQAFQAVRLPPPPNPELPDLPEGRDRMLEIHEQQALMLEVPERWALHVLVLLQLGVRRSELLKLGEIDWEHRRIRVHGTKTKRGVRWVPIPMQLFRELEARRATWAGLEYWDHADRMLKAAAKRAGMQPISCNDLRRTYATFMARAGVQALQLAKYMGTSVKMLERVYARLERPGDHDLAAVDAGVPNIPGARTVLENSTPAANPPGAVGQRAGQRSETFEDFGPAWPVVQ